jgi:hypothetical protein
MARAVIAAVPTVVIARLRLTVPTVVIARLRLTVPTVVIARLELAAVPHVTCRVVGSVPVVTRRVVGPVMVVVSSVVIARLRLAAPIGDAYVGRGWAVVGRRERRPRSERRGGDQGAGGGQDGDALHGCSSGVRSPCLHSHRVPVGTAIGRWS